MTLSLPYLPWSRQQASRVRVRSSGRLQAAPGRGLSQEIRSRRGHARALPGQVAEARERNAGRVVRRAEAAQAKIEIFDGRGGSIRSHASADGELCLGGRPVGSALDIAAQVARMTVEREWRSGDEVARGFAPSRCVQRGFAWYLYAPEPHFYRSAEIGWRTQLDSAVVANISALDFPSGDQTQEALSIRGRN